VLNNPLLYRDPSGHEPDKSNCSYAGLGCHEFYYYTLAKVHGQIARAEEAYRTENRIVHTRFGGWLDRDHATSDFILKVSSATAGSGVFEVNLSAGGKPNAVVLEYQVELGLTGDKVVSVALGIFMHAKQIEEEAQGRVAIGAWSSFAREDLPSDLVGFFMEKFGMTFNEVADRYLGGLDDYQSDTANALRNLFADRNYEFRPIDRVWPAAFLVALNTDAASEGNGWRLLARTESLPSAIDTIKSRLP
jgi:hypothetical protein